MNTQKIAITIFVIFLTSQIARADCFTFSTKSPKALSRFDLAIEEIKIGHNLDAFNYFKEATDFGKQMADYSQRISRGETGLIPEIFPSKPIPPLPEEFKILLTYNKGECGYPKCRLCMDYCPVGAIDLSAEPTVFQKENCIYCYFCEKICPTGAIDGE